MPQIPHGRDDLDCPFHRKAMSKVCHKCPLWVQVKGQDPQGGDVDEWRCAFGWMPLMLIENAHQIRQGAAAIESTRNIFSKALDFASMRRIIGK